ncbi:hypothetical protein B0H10DRAFT_1939565 [Mycena sp. CBHHK59/15]|nr:hypothetical protein B0H10DRAFT_1939565 [Mycena sp. CBHHK59/15]
MADVVELDTDVPFDCSHWIDAGNIYKDVPEEVADACSAAHEIPSNLAATLPSRAISVTEFLALEFIQSKPGNPKSIAKDYEWIPHFRKLGTIGGSQVESLSSGEWDAGSMLPCPICEVMRKPMEASAGHRKKLGHGEKGSTHSLVTLVEGVEEF